MIEATRVGRPGYSPVHADGSGTIDVELASDHPGVTDPAYRARRNDLAGLALAWRPGSPIPRVAYTDAETGVWATASAALADLHAERACAEFLAAKAALRLPAERVPQLDELAPGLCGFRFEPVAGLAPLRQFYANFAAGVFASTQYLRHPSVPLYTPEPDLIHEVIGHANHLASARFADLYRRVGAAVARTGDDDALRFLSKVFWFTLEFGVVREDNAWKAYGAGILSSSGEMESFRDAAVETIDFTAMGTATYDITRYQPVLYGFDSMDEAFAVLTDFFDGYSDERYRTLVAA